MDTSRISNKLIESLPEQLNVVGFGANRAVYIDGNLLTPEKSQKIHNHSPDGFNWGYAGSGPAQLALAILAEHLPAKIAKEMYQIFKFHIISGLPGTNFEIDLQLRRWVEYIKTVQEMDNAMQLSDLIAPKNFYTPKNVEERMDHQPAHGGYHMGDVEVQETDIAKHINRLK